MSRSRLLPGVAFALLAVGVLAAPMARAANPSVASVADVERLVAAAPKIARLPADLNPPLKDVPADTAYNYLHDAKCEPDFPEVKVASCIFGDPHGARTMVLFGDSHAQMWFPGFDALAKRRHWRLAYLGKSSCGVPALHYFDSTRKRPFTECDQWKSYAIARIRSLHPALIVVTSEYLTPEDANQKPIPPSAWSVGLAKTLRLLRAPGVKRVVLGDIPYLPQSAPDCLAAHQNDIQACSAPASKAVQADHDAAEQKAAKETGVKYISVVPWFCSATCTAVVGRTAVYFDAFHISQTYATYLSGALESVLSPSMGGR